jgi:hypothetical protein
MIQQIIRRRYFPVSSRFISFLLHSNRVAAADESPPVLALYRIYRSEVVLFWRPGRREEYGDPPALKSFGSRSRALSWPLSLTTMSTWAWAKKYLFAFYQLSSTRVSFNLIRPAGQMFFRGQLTSSRNWIKSNCMTETIEWEVSDEMQ